MYGSSQKLLSRPTRFSPSQRRTEFEHAYCPATHYTSSNLRKNTVENSVCLSEEPRTNEKEVNCLANVFQQKRCSCSLSKNLEMRVSTSTFVEFRGLTVIQPTSKVTEFLSFGPLIGKGAFGEVYKCKTPKSTGIYACKIIPKDGFRESAELKTLMSLQKHNSVIKLKAVLEDSVVNTFEVNFCSTSLAKSIVSFFSLRMPTW